jgi:hypothetical protein
VCGAIDRIMIRHVTPRRHNMLSLYSPHILSIFPSCYPYFPHIPSIFPLCYPYFPYITLVSLILPLYFSPSPPAHVGGKTFTPTAPRNSNPNNDITLSPRTPTQSQPQSQTQTPATPAAGKNQRSWVRPLLSSPFSDSSLRCLS